MKEIIVYTDGSYKSSLDRGGIGVIWLKNGKIIQEFSKGFNHVTNNIMELMAIYVALKCIIKPIDSLEIISDSEYSIGVLTKDWKPKKNVKLILKIDIHEPGILFPLVRYEVFHPDTKETFGPLSKIDKGEGICL